MRIIKPFSCETTYWFKVLLNAVWFYDTSLTNMRGFKTWHVLMYVFLLLLSYDWYRNMNISVNYSVLKLTSVKDFTVQVNYHGIL